MIDISTLTRASNAIRGSLVETSHKRHISHLGSSLSCVDMLVAIYWHALNADPSQPDLPGSDKFILSKGHAGAALFATLAHRGYFPLELLDTFGAPGNPLSEHPAPNCVPGVDIATGSLGHGLSFALGMALGARLNKEQKHFYVLMGDGEINEGSVWEAAMFAPAQKLDNVIALVDFNKWQATDRSKNVMALDPIADKFRAFGWATMEVDGHNLPQLIDSLETAKSIKGQPSVIVCDTVKAKGISFMEDDNNWHYRIPTAEEVTQAHQELGLID